MPVAFDIWRLDGPGGRLIAARLDDEARLEDVLHRDITFLGLNVMVLGRQVITAYGKRIDLLTIDAQGDLAIIELKRERTPREVVAQLLDYGSWVQGLTYEQIAALHTAHHPDTPFERAFAERFGVDPPETLNERHQLIIVAAELDASTERIVTYLAQQYGVPINALFFRYFRDREREYLARTWLIDPEMAEADTIKVTPAKPGREVWNGQDYYVSLGEGTSRNWEDCVRYGFVSGGQGEWYSNSLKTLKPDARIFACIPGTGYVGVGRVMEAALPVKDFLVKVDGEHIPVLDAPLRAADMGQNADDPKLSEYLVRVAWDKTLPRDQAIWEKGMFANQNTACRLRNKFTLDRLAERFGLTE